MTGQSKPGARTFMSGLGFQVTFENGWTVSVGIGPGHYTNDRSMDRVNLTGGTDSVEAETFEVAAVTPQGDVQEPDGWQTPKELLATMNRVAAL
jgi:hypothetical protein